MDTPTPIFQSPELQNILSQLDKLSKAELNLVQFIIQGFIEERPKLTPEEVAEINEKNQKAVDDIYTTTIERITGEGKTLFKHTLIKESEDTYGIQTCIDCGKYPLVFESEADNSVLNEVSSPYKLPPFSKQEEYEPDPETGDPRCFSCDLKANPTRYD